MYLLIGLFAYLFILPRQAALAVGEFQADYDVNYNVAPDGRTIVTQNISLTNRLTNLYPTKYSILIDTEKIRDVVAYDPKGAIRPVITQKDGKTEILLPFNDRVVGIGKKLSFTLRFVNDEIAQKNGGVWEVNIPGITPDTDINRYTVSLEVPSSFGPNAYLSPQPADGKHWNKEQMIAGGISAAYGNLQAFSLSLSYFLQNTKITPATGEIALPPDTAFQKVILHSLEPKPVLIRQDDDGNWLAQYALKPNQKLDIRTSLTVLTTIDARNEYGKTHIVSQEYTKPLKFWDTDDPKIVSLAQTLRTPKAIYDYVAKTLSYDYSRVNENSARKGAVAALSLPQSAICMEFTDLFIAIARAAGIPAREVVGYAYTTNAKLRPLSLVADVLHAWPEYYDNDRNIWIPVDPTWANTTKGVDYFDKLDFNHITFAIHGRSSDTPYPAGFYKQSGSQSKDVLVGFADAPASLPTAPKLTILFELPNVLPAGFTSKGQLVIENASDRAVDTIDIRMEGSPFPFLLTKQVGGIPPLGKLTIPITLNIDGYLRSEKGRITATVNDEVVNYYITIQPVWILFLPFGLAIVFLAVGLWYIFARKSLWTLLRR